MSENPQRDAGAPPGRPGEERRREVFRLVAILLVALALRLVFTYQVQRGPFEYFARIMPGTDMSQHDRIARWVLANNWYEKSIDASPLYSHVVLPVLYKVTGGSVFWTLIIQSFFDSVTVFLVYLLARRLFAGRAAVYAGIAAALYAPFIIYQAQLLGESMLNVLITAFFVAMLPPVGRPGALRALAAGLLLGLACAASAACFVFAPLAVLLVWRESGRRFRTTVVLVAAAALGCFAALLPFAWRDYKSTGEFTLLNGGAMLYMGNNSDATGEYGIPSDAAAVELARKADGLTFRGRDQLYRAAALRFVLDNPGRALRLFCTKFRLFFSAPEVPHNLSTKLYRQKTFLRAWPFATFGIVFPLALVAFAMTLGRPRVWFLAGGAALYSLVTIACVVTGGYRLGIVGLILPAAGFAAAELMLAAKTLDFRRTAAIALPAAALAVLVNWSQISASAAQRFHPDGFTESADDAIRVRDDSDYPTPFGASVSGEKSCVAKALVIGRLPKPVDRASILVLMSVARQGILTVEANDSVQRMGLVCQPKQWVRIPIAADSLKEGRNVIYLRGDDDLSAFVYADDVYHFRRSVYTPDGGHSWSDELDRSSYLRDPSLHLGGHEFKIRLELRSSPTAVP